MNKSLKQRRRSTTMKSNKKTLNDGATVRGLTLTQVIESERDRLKQKIEEHHRRYLRTMNRAIDQLNREVAEIVNSI